MRITDGTLAACGRNGRHHVNQKDTTSAALVGRRLDALVSPPFLSFNIYALLSLRIQCPLQSGGVTVGTTAAAAQAI